MNGDDLLYRDPLTGAYNRRFLDELFGERWAALRREHGPIAVVLLDLDGFKEINDRNGHLLGDAFLRATASRLATLARRTDFLVRYGGDEFVLVMPGLGEPEGQLVAEAIRRSALREQIAVEADGKSLEAPLCFSFGVGCSPTDGEAGEEALAAADRRLYEDKKRRRPRRGASVLPARLLLLLLLATLLVAVYALTSAHRLASEEAARLAAPATPAASAPPPATPTPAATTPAAGTPLPIEEALLVQIGELERQVESLKKELAKPAARAPGPGEIATLKDTIEELEQELGAARKAGPRPAPSGGPVPTREPAATPGTRAVPGATAASSPPTRPSPGASPPPPRPSPEGTAPAPARAGTETAPSSAVPMAPPLLTRFARPDYPRAARELRKEATVIVRVRVGPDGRVSAAEVEGGPYGFGFEEAALRAARGAVYRPGTVDGARAEMDSRLFIRFRLGAGGG